ncbi:MAG: alkaline phosphatase family protein [Chloroflexota bacterium]|nr:alkaline phosphatase family protein [Chloroflexota bacterium]
MLVVGVAASGALLRDTCPSAPLSANALPVPGDGVPSFRHIYLLVMENKAQGEIVGHPDAPFINHLINHYASATDYRSVGSPSQPNYLALFSGCTHGIDDNAPHNIAGPSIASQLEAAGRSWRVVAENVPAGCFTGALSSDGPDGSGTYARKHNPAISFIAIQQSASACANIVDFSHFKPGAADFQFIVPNLCHDMHNCTVAVGDAFLKQFVGDLIDSPSWTSDDVLFIAWEEGHASSQNKVPFIVVSDRVKSSGYVSAKLYTHYSLLRTVQAAWQLPCLHESCSANPLSDFFSQQR